MTVYECNKYSASELEKPGRRNSVPGLALAHGSPPDPLLALVYSWGLSVEFCGIVKEKRIRFQDWSCLFVT